MKFISYKCEFVGKINEIHILINEKSNREILGFFKISRDISGPKIEPGSRELNPTVNPCPSPHAHTRSRKIKKEYYLIL